MREEVGSICGAELICADVVNELAGVGFADGRRGFDAFSNRLGSSTCRGELFLESRRDVWHFDGAVKVGRGNRVMSKTALLRCSRGKDIVDGCERTLVSS